jgi:hypothetical protein|tara:strand:+ start:283 stop:648 length:366 start_codon:yes stop_codon:yes gene_type:complete
MKLETAKKLLSNIKFGQTRNAARKKTGQGLTVKDIELTAEDLIKIYSEQKGKCYWSNIGLDEQYNYITRHPLAISVDRLDNKKGYVYGNVALTLRVFNLGKASYTGDFKSVVNFIKESWDK